MKEILKISDAHNDFITKLNDDALENYLQKCYKAGVRNLVVSIWTTEFKNGIEDFKKFADKFLALKSKTKINLLLHIEDAWFINSQNIGEILAYKPFSIGLCWNDKNHLCGGCDTNCGLTEQGKALIKVLEENKILIDTAHMSKKTFNQFIKITSFPIYCSHTMFAREFKHTRNLNNFQLKKIIKSGGIIGLAFVSNFYKKVGKVTASEIALSVSKFLKKYKCQNNLCLGTDFYGTDNLPTNICGYNDIILLKNELTKIGIMPQISQKIIFENFNLFYKLIG